MKTFRHEGHVRNITPAAAIVAGAIVSLGASGRVGIAPADIAENELGVVNISGVYQVPAPAHGLAQDDEVRMDLTTQTVVPTGGTVIGVVDEVYDAGTVDVLLNSLPSGGL